MNTEYRIPSWVAYVDFRSAFDSLDKHSLWLLLLSKGIPDQVTELINTSTVTYSVVLE